MSKFIKTSDENVAAQLRAASFICIGFEDNTKEFLFLNNDKPLPLNFEDEKKLVFTDMLMF